MHYLEERDVGFPAGPVRVPIVPAAVIFDLRVGDPKVRPDAEMGYQACVNATDAPVAMGLVGAGTGATVGKIPGLTPSNGGLGSMCAVLMDSGLMVGALVVVNAVGNIVDPATGAVLAGARHAASGAFVDVTAYLAETKPFESTTIGVVATNATLTPTEATKVAQMAHDGLARTIRPIHTMFDGDTIFALATGSQQSSVNTVGILAAEVMAQAVLRSIALPA
jgi:L-aminopeptidase/D-esterase-like protein